MTNRALMIESQDLRRSFNGNEAVAGISFGVTHGEIFGLLGPNGAGKTTIIRLLSGQIDPSGGRAVVAGCDVVSERSRLKERIGVVFEEQNLYDRLSAAINLKFNCWIYNLPESRVDEVLELAHLRDRAKDPVRTFSNGMKQRLMIARALLHKPPVLFLDEPTRGLDPLAARDVRNEIEQLSREGMTILLTTHLLEDAEVLCKRVAFIVKGHIVANDTVRNLKLAHGKRNLLVTLSDPDSPDQKKDILLSMDNRENIAQLDQLMTQGQVLALHSQEATLEEVFIEIAGIRPA
jgi:ABC-2 type transport system ATP-binding protein